MACEIATIPPIRSEAGGRPRISSYDSGYEHSIEHWMDVKGLVEDEADTGGERLAWGSQAWLIHPSCRS
jgi:hypothetical protein